MHTLFSVLLSASLLAVGYQDFRYRRVSLLLLIISFFLSLGYMHGAPAVSITTLLVNLGLIGFQLLTARVYIMLRKGTHEPFFDKYIGWADVWLLVQTAVLFGIQEYFLVYALSLVIALVFSFVLSFGWFGHDRSVPLAGIVAGAVVLMFASDVSFVT